MLSSAFSTGQSAIASEPSRIDSVSRFGDATEPESRWSRPITIGAFTCRDATRSLKIAPGLRAVAVAEPADARGQPLEVHALLRQREPAHEVLVVREGLQERAVGRVDVLGIAGERHPAERPVALAEQRADERGHESRIAEVVHAGVLGLAAEVVAVVEQHGAAALELEHRAHLRGDRLVRASQVLLRIARAQRRGVRRPTDRPARSR